MSDNFYDTLEADEIRANLWDYVQRYCDRSAYPKNGEPFSCPYCHSGDGSSGKKSSSAFHVYKNQSIPKYHCSSCGAVGDIFDLISHIEGLSGGDIITRARQLYGTSNNYYIKAQNKTKQVEAIPAEGTTAVCEDATSDFKEENNDRHINTPKTNKNADMGKIEGIGQAVSDDKESETVPAADYTRYLIECHAQVTQTGYLKARGFTDEIINRFSLGYDNKYNGITIPYNANGTYYALRYITPTNSKCRFYKPKQSEAGPEPIFNPTALYSGEPVYVFEGQLDALSVIQAGGNAIAIGGTGGTEKLKAAIRTKRPNNTLIISMDPDEAGAKAYKKIAEMLTAAGINFIKAQYSYNDYEEPVKDTNDMLRVNAALLTQDVRRNTRRAWTKKAFRPYNIKEYLSSGAYNADIGYFKEYKDRKTGFKNIDEHLTLYAGLAALGGSASLGKTTFAVNLCDNLTDAGESVLYFALEQEPIELVTKILARRSYNADTNTNITNFDIKNGRTCEALERVKADYMDKAERFNIIRCNFTTTAEDIKDFVLNYMQATNTRPIVVIDYLQLISPPADFKGDIRAATDHVIKVLKTMQVENDLFVLMISNFNRGAYNTTVSYESFKETGMIEFTCDYIWGLQLAVMESDAFYIKDGGRKKTEQQDRNQLIYEENKKNPKNVVFVSLKSRNGKQCYKSFFKYHMQHDAFIEDFNSEYDKESAAYKEKFEIQEKREALKGFKPATKKQLEALPFKQEKFEGLEPV